MFLTRRWMPPATRVGEPLGVTLKGMGWGRMGGRGRHCVSSVALSVVLVVAFAACGGSVDAGTSGARAVTSPTANPLGALSVYAATDDNLCTLRVSDGKQHACYGQRNNIPVAAADGVAYGAYQGTVFAMRSADGTYRWRQPLGTQNWVTALSLAGGTLYVATRSADPHAQTGELYALRAVDGALLWHLVLASVPTPEMQVLGGAVYLSSSIDGSDGSVIYTVTAISAGDGTVLWHSSLDGGGTFAVDALALYVCSADGEISALRLSDQVLLWRRPLQGCRTVQALGDAVYVSAVPSQDQPGWFFALRPSDGNLLWQFHVAQVAVPATRVGDVLYVATQGPTAHVSGDNWLYALRAADGQELWQEPIASSVADPLQILTTPPVVANDVVLLGVTSVPSTLHGHQADVYAFARADGHALWHAAIVRGGAVGTLRPLAVG